MKLKLEHVNKTIKKALVLDDVTITLEGGRIYGLKGPNGSGKTMCDVNLPPDQNTLNENDDVFIHKRAQEKGSSPPLLRCVLHFQRPGDILHGVPCGLGRLSGHLLHFALLLGTQRHAHDSTGQHTQASHRNHHTHLHRTVPPLLWV